MFHVSTFCEEALCHRAEIHPIEIPTGETVSQMLHGMGGFPYKGSK